MKLVSYTRLGRCNATILREFQAIAAALSAAAGIRIMAIKQQVAE